MARCQEAALRLAQQLRRLGARRLLDELLEVRRLVQQLLELGLELRPVLPGQRLDAVHQRHHRLAELRLRLLALLEVRHDADLLGESS